MQRQNIDIGIFFCILFGVSMVVASDVIKPGLDEGAWYAASGLLRLAFAAAELWVFKRLFRMYNDVSEITI